MRELFTTKQAEEQGLTQSALRHGVTSGRWQRPVVGVYAKGPEPVSALDRERARAVACNGIAVGELAGQLLGLDGVDGGNGCVAVEPNRSGRRAGVRRVDIDSGRVIVVGGVRCTDALQTLLDLAGCLDDLRWEQALESALRKGLVTIEQIELLAAARPGARAHSRMRRVLAIRPVGAPPTGSLLETLAVQLVRQIPDLPPPTRQHPVLDEHGEVIAYVDLCWPELGLFLELDGQWHKDQPVYDARRETAVVAATGWLVGRFTWKEIVDLPTSSRRRMVDLIAQARRRPLPV